MKVLFFALIPIVFLWARPAERSSCERKYVVGLNNYAPFAYRENGRLQGVAHDMVAELSQRTRCTFQENEVSRPLAVEDLKRGRLDIMIFVVKSTELDRSGNFLPLFKSQRELAIVKSHWQSEKKISDYVNDDKVKFAHLIGTEVVVAPESDKKLMASSRLIGVADPESAFNLLLKGRAQAVLFSAFTTDYYFGKLNLKAKIIRVPDTATPIDVGIYTSKRRVSNGEERKIVEAFAEMRKDGTLQKILAKYMGEAEARKRLQPN